MSSSKNNNNFLLLAGLGVGAALFFANKSKGKNVIATNDEVADIPNAPKILAVNNSMKEQDVPEGMVSDDEDMEPVSASNTTSKNTSSFSTSSSNNDAFFDDEKINDETEIPALVSTTLTSKEKEIINSGKLTPALALKRPDLFRASYVKRYGGQTLASKQKALRNANQIIKTNVHAVQAVNAGKLPLVYKYPAASEYTFVQAGAGMTNQNLMTQIKPLHDAGIKISPATKKQVKPLVSKKATKPKPVIKKTVLKKTSKPVVKKPVSKKPLNKKTK